MLVTCPRCESIFKLPDSTNPQTKMRCSICNNVFRLDEVKVLPDDAPLPKQEEASSYQINSFKIDDGASPKKNSIFVRVILILLFISMATAGILMKFTTVLDPIKGIFTRDSLVVEEQKEEVEDLFARVRQLELINVRQFVVPNSENDKFQKLTVIEGSVVNRFDSPRSFVELEASLYDAEGNVLESKTQMAGPRVSFFQLQVLGQAELEEALRDNIYILNYNTNIQPSQTVPFMFIFYNPPEDAANFNVKIINAQIPDGVPAPEPEN